MSDKSCSTRINAQGAVTIRQKPKLLLMKIDLEAVAATLELALTNIKKQCAAASRWLQGLAANSVEFGEPHFVNPVADDPLRRAQEITARAMGRRAPAPPPTERQRTVHVILTALWDVAAMSAEERLVFLDRLQFEATQDSSNSEATEQGVESRLAGPEEQMQEILTEMMKPISRDTRQPQFLFISQLEEAALVEANLQAFQLACRQVERLTAAAGLPPGRLESVSYGHNYGDASRSDRIMERQRCLGILEGTSYLLSDKEVISEDPRSVDFTVSVTVGYVSNSDRTSS